MQQQHIAIPRSVPGRASAGWLAVVTIGLALVSSVSALAQGAAPAEPERRTVTVGHYAASSLKRLAWGSGYRDLWMTPVSVEVLDFTNEAGGLRPVRRVGGQQTRVLALEGRDGRSYSFRALVKDTSHLLDFFDPQLQKSVVVKLLDDLMSAQHPAGELVAGGILEAAGVPSQRWRLVALPDDPALGEFGSEFAGAVGVFGEYPQPAKGSQPGFMGAAEIIDHLEFYKRLEAGDAAADTRALLRARLVDVLIGDWDRHRRQWRWAKTNDSPLFTPIPEDRDQAFSRYDGYLLGRTRARDPRFQKFGPRYEGIGGLTFNGWDQDRRLLAGFTREDFVETAKEVAARVTDEAIEAAARRMPPEWYAVDGKRLVSDLRARRDALPEAAEKYYRNLASGRRRLHDEPQRARPGRPHAEGRHGGHGERARRRRAGGGDHLPPRVPRERDGGSALLRARRGRHDRRDRRRPGPARAHDRGQGRRHARGDGRRQGEAVRLGRPQPRDRGGPRRRALPRSGPADERALDPGARLHARDLAGAGLRVQRRRRLLRRVLPAAGALRLPQDPLRERATPDRRLCVPAERRPRGVRGRLPQGEQPHLLQRSRLRLVRRGAAVLRLGQRDRGHGGPEVLPRSRQPVPPVSVLAFRLRQRRRAPRRPGAQVHLERPEPRRVHQHGQPVRRGRLRRAGRARRPVLGRPRQQGPCPGAASSRRCAGPGSRRPGTSTATSAR